ncbi:hypothetical protein [Fibrella aquatilis]|uniref:Uncharacterized protein n=1 Tax=Fibrella aquatilis TaxID=2817059 RepID=A0A939G1C8_9BACT|nr:hypothetical protein [Fibrella aquatilis]MBO0930199.1 hypothetical protein [Fibrella aquatilis]
MANRRKDIVMPEQSAGMGFQIRAVRVKAFTINEQSDGSPEAVEFSIQLQHLRLADTEDWIVEVQVTMAVSGAQTPVAELTVDCQYRLAGYKLWLQQQPDLVSKPGTLPTGLAATLNSISVSTTRGILFERLLGTQWQQAILPVIDPVAFQVMES